MKTNAALLAVTLVAFLASSLFAQDNASTLIYFEGRVDVLGRESGQRKAVKGMKIEEGEAVRTLADAVAVVLLPDGSRLKLREQTLLRLSRFTKGESGRTTRLDLISGSVFTKVAKLGVSDQFTLQAATAVAGVRGTEFFTAHAPKGPSGGEDVWLCVNEGEVAVKGAEGPEARVKAGEGIQVKGGKEVTPPKPYPWTKNLNWNMEDSKGKLKDKTRLDRLYADPAGVPYD